MLRLGEFCRWICWDHRLIWASLFLTAFKIHTAQGQNLQQGVYWYLGDHNSFDFRFTPPAPIAINPISTLRTRTSAINDENGNLILYSNCDTVWNKNNQILINGTGINPSPGPFAFNSCVIIPHPGDGQLYYVFTTSQGNEAAFAPHVSGGGISKFAYSLIDISANGGQGQVIQKGQELFRGSTNLLTAGPDATETGFWVIGHDSVDTFYAYHITQSGLDPTPVISKNVAFEYLIERQMKMSPDGTKLALVNAGRPHFFTFDSKTGEIKYLGVHALGFGANNVEFSPNSRFVYFAGDFSLNFVQFDVSSDDFDEIMASENRVGAWTWGGYYADIQLAADGKIYGALEPAIGGEKYMISIDKPNLKGAACEVNHQGLKLQYDPPGIPLVQSLLPLSVQSFLRDSPSLLTPDGCKDFPTAVQVVGLGYADSVQWDFGDGTKESFTSNLSRPVYHSYANTGPFTVKLKKFLGNITRELTSSLMVVEAPRVVIPGDTIICNGGTVMLDAGNDGTSYAWSTGATVSSIQVDQSGTFRVAVSNQGCTVTDSTRVQVNNYPQISLGPDIVACTDSIKLSVPANGAYRYVWSTGQQDNSITIDQSGFYSVSVAFGPCVSADTVHVDFDPIDNFHLAASDITPVYGEPTVIQATGNNIDQVNWVFGDGDKTTGGLSVKHLYVNAGHYQGVATATNEKGCQESAPFTIDFPVWLNVPTVFTPNGDTVNDTFEVQFNGESITIVVYNRWGEQVFSSATLTPYWNGENVSTGTYYYKVITADKTVTGWVSVIK